MNIKVCGITQLKQLQQLDALGIDFAGFIFCIDSPRYAKDKIMPSDVADADFDLKKVGVFVDMAFDEIMKIADDYKLDCVQLHGNENLKLCDALSKELEVIKTFHVHNSSIETVNKFINDYDVCDYYLFDTALKVGLSGGTGVQFDWNILKNLNIEKPFFLSGGISLNDVEKIKSLRHPDLFAIDINSQFETAPGVKNLTQVVQFKKELKG
ncbi:MAG: phosphoribosylanthranilate isomerase [Chitinophagaceae bacterium]|nr:MAG: phosphoribosylanthranilate isomerase [Chitinophagaceae bacterium]